METLQNTQAIKEGWYHHPIAALETVQALDFSENVKLLDGMYKTLLGGHVLDNPLQSAEDVRALLEKVSSSDPKVAQEAVKDLMHWLFNQVKVLEKDPYLFDRGIMLLKNAATIGHRILEEERPHMERLHAAKLLEALLMQKATASIVNSDSLWQILQQKSALKKSEIKEIELSEDESKSLKLLQKTNERFQLPITPGEKRTAAAIYQSVQSRGLNPEIQRQWEEFTQKLLTSGSRAINRELINMIKETQKLGAFEEWINVSFNQSWKASGQDTIVTLLKLKQEMNGSQEALKAIDTARKELSKWKEMESHWGDPAKFDQLFGKFQATVLKDIREISNLYKNTPETNVLSRSILMAYLQDSVDLFDVSIKAMRGSAQYGDKSQQALNFREMLIPYMGIMWEWVPSIPEDTVKAWLRTAGTAKIDYEDFRQGALTEIYKKFENITVFDETQLRPSQKFNVNNSAIDSGTYWSQKLSEDQDLTLEDLFTLTHQNILAALRAQYKDHLQELLPLEVQGLNQMFLGIDEKLTWTGKRHFKLDAKANLLDTQYHYPTVTIRYNIPIKNHGARIEVTYDLETKKAQVDLRVLAHNLGNRMKKITDNTFMQNIAANITMVEYPLYDEMHSMLTYSFILDEQDLNEAEATNSKASISKNILIKVIRDTLEDPSRTMPEFDLDNPKLLELLWKSPEATNAWKQADYPYFGYFMETYSEKGYLSELVELAKAGGVPIEDSDKPESVRIAEGIIKMMTNRDPALVSTSHNFWSLNFLNTNEEALQTLINEYQNVFFYETDSFDNYNYVKRLQETILHALNPESEDAHNYMLFLLSLNQHDLLAEHYFDTNRGQNIKNEEIRNLLISTFSNAFLLGYPVNENEIQNRLEITDLDQLQPGQEVIYTKGIDLIAGQILQMAGKSGGTTAIDVVGKGGIYERIYVNEDHPIFLRGAAFQPPENPENPNGEQLNV